MIAARERRPYEIEDRVAPGESVIITLEADETWDPDDPATLAAAMRPALDELARAAGHQAACIRASFTRIAEYADSLSLAATIQAGVAAAVDDTTQATHAIRLAVAAAVRVARGAFWSHLSALVARLSDSLVVVAQMVRGLTAALLDGEFPHPRPRRAASEIEPEDPDMRDGWLLLHAPGGPVDDRTRGEAAARWARRLVRRWWVRREDREALERVAHDRLADRQQGFGAGAVTGGEHALLLHDATKYELLLVAVSTVLLGGDWRLLPLSARWRRRLPGALSDAEVAEFEQRLAARGKVLSAVQLPWEARRDWIDRRIMTVAERMLREEAHGSAEGGTQASEYAAHCVSLDAPSSTAEREVAPEDDPHSTMSQASRAWSRRDLWALSRDWEREQREEEAAAKAAAIEQACRDADLTPMQQALLDAVLRNGGDPVAAAEELKLRPGTGRTEWHRLKKRLEPALRSRLAATPA